ncbi:MAG TPA: dihydrolipoamide acetyltransferase family protein [Candidatus Nanopelagicaceae bacterium]
MATNTAFDFLLPDVGEGLEDAEIVNWKVAVGQQIEVNQPLVEIESAKSLVELPSPYAGTVLELLAKEGEVVRVGTAIIRIQLDTGGQTSDVLGETGKTEFLVGSISKGEESRRQQGSTRNYGKKSTPTDVIVEPVAKKPSGGLATPPVRKLARELGVVLDNLVGSGPQGSVTREDVTAFAAKSKGASVVTPVLGDVVRESRTPIRGVRRSMAEAMVSSAFTAPHVTEFITVDVTASMQFLDRLRTQPEYVGVRLSPLTLLARAMCLAAHRTPAVNSYWDEAAQEIVTKHYVNLGIAAATDRGLLVPNIKDADQLTLKQLAVSISEIVDAARAGRTEPAQMTGGTMSITNIGVFGIDTGTPILPPGESVIVALGAVVQRPWVVDGQIMVRYVTTLALSFDHRLVDGAQGSKFLAEVAMMMQEPAMLLAWA